MQCAPRTSPPEDTRWRAPGSSPRSDDPAYRRKIPGGASTLSGAPKPPDAFSPLLHKAISFY